MTNRSFMFGALCTVALLIAVRGDTQIYFQDDFEDPAASAEKWVDLYGTWELADGEYHQSEGVPNAMSVVADASWDDAIDEYTFEVRGKKTGGGEGFLIMFRLRGTMDPRGVAVRDHPPVMAAQAPSLDTMVAPRGDVGVQSVPKAGHWSGFLSPCRISPLMQTSGSAGEIPATANLRSASWAA